MQYRSLGRSGLKVSAVSIGGWLTFGAKVDGAETARILGRAFEHGINFVDLADVYANGRCEEVVGAALRDRDRSQLVLSSKVFWPMSDDVNDRGLSRKHIMESVEASLRRLGTDYLDLYFCHREDPGTPLEETARAMDDLVRQGKVLYWGTSVWRAETLREAHAICDRRNLYAPVVEQPRYNLVDRHIEADVVPACAELGMGLVVWSPLAGGLLTGKYNDGLPEGSRGDESAWLDDTLNAPNLERARAMSGIAERIGVTSAQLALAWALHKPGISSVIIGASRPDHVDENVRASDLALDPETVAELDTLFA